jgi:PAS domain S-box-containing protein
MPPTRKILVVDDDANVCRTLTDILRIKGYAPLAAVRGADACVLVREQRPDLALIDLKLPDMDGISLIREFRRLLPGMECILLTGHVTQESAIEAVNLGAYSYLVKPYDMGHLLITVRRALERRDAAEALCRSEAQYRELVQNANSIILRLDSEGRITFFNEYAERYFGYSQEEILGANVLGTIVPETESTGRSLTTMVQGIVNEPERYAVNENENMRKDGARAWVLWSNKVIRDERGAFTGILSVGSDITAVKQIEGQLRLRVRQQAAVAELGRRALAEHDLSAILEEAVRLTASGLDVGLVDVLELLPDRDALLLCAGTGWKEGLVGRATVQSGPETLAGQALAGNDGVIVQDLHAGVGHGGVEILHDHGVMSGITMAIPGDGAPFGVLGAYVCVQRVFSRQDVMFLQSMANILGDAIARKNAEDRLERKRQQLRALASDLALAEERERHRIAVGLHDQVIQNLAVATIRLDGLRESLHTAEARNALQMVRDSTGAAIADLRSLTFELSPPVLYELGLESALQYLAEQMAREHGMPVQYQDDGMEKPLSGDIQVTLYRSVRELIMNAVKHARAGGLKLSVSRLAGHISIIVEDDGVGFDSTALEARNPAATGFGLFSIRERLCCLGGQIAIDSKLGHGTRIALTAPLAPEDEA